MQAIIDSMQTTFLMAGGSAGLSAIFLASLMALWHYKYESKNEVRNLFWYALVMLIVLVIPLFNILVKYLLPELYAGNMYLWVLPVVPVTMYVAVVVITSLDNSFKKIVFMLGLIAITILAATTSYNQNKLRLVNNNHYIDSEVIPTFDSLLEYKEKKEMDHIKVWGPNEIMAYARRYDGNIHVLYGEDLYNENAYTHLKQEYDEQYSLAFELMNRASDYLGEIVNLAVDNNVDAIVLKTEAFNNYEGGVPRILGSKYLLVYYDVYYCTYVTAVNNN